MSPTRPKRQKYSVTFIAFYRQSASFWPGGEACTASRAMAPRRTRASQKGSTPDRANKHRRAAEDDDDNEEEAEVADEDDDDFIVEEGRGVAQEDEAEEEQAEEEDNDAMSGDDEPKDEKEHRRKGLYCVPIGASFTIEVNGGSIAVTRLGPDSAKCNGCDHKFAKHSYHISQIRQHGESCLRKAVAKDAAAEAKQEKAAAKSAAKAHASQPEVKWESWLAEPPVSVTTIVEGEAVTCNFQNILIGECRRIVRVFLHTMT